MKNNLNVKLILKNFIFFIKLKEHSHFLDLVYLIFRLFLILYVLVLG